MFTASFVPIIIWNQQLLCYRFECLDYLFCTRQCVGNW